MKPQRGRDRVLLQTVASLAVGVLLFGSVGSADGQSSASYEVTRSVMSGGGGRSSSASYSLTGTLGQPSPVHVSESENSNLGSGFWGGMVRLFSVAVESISYSVAEGVRITWHSLTDATYAVYFTNSLSETWQRLSEIVGTGSLMEWLDDGSETGSSPTASGVLKRFYRLLGQPGTL